MSQKTDNQPGMSKKEKKNQKIKEKSQAFNNSQMPKIV